MNSPKSTANFNFSSINDSQFLNNNSDPRQSGPGRQPSIGQSIGTSAQLPANVRDGFYRCRISRLVGVLMGI